MEVLGALRIGRLVVVFASSLPLAQIALAICSPRLRLQLDGGVRELAGVERREREVELPALHSIGLRLGPPSHLGSRLRAPLIEERMGPSLWKRSPEPGAREVQK